MWGRYSDEGFCSEENDWDSNYSSNDNYDMDSMVDEFEEVDDISLKENYRHSYLKKVFPRQIGSQNFQPDINCQMWFLELRSDFVNQIEGVSLATETSNTNNTENSGSDYGNDSKNEMEVEKTAKSVTLRFPFMKALWHSHRDKKNCASNVIKRKFQESKKHNFERMGCPSLTNVV
mmetsp:Transcript_20765/g.30738  ORF Transcript_20765/g.30738 Transcript_20765/m.30738 type:complete len:176 (+) Transcript_20765:82-609(+)|eukprot:CAMPEP_0171463246 /NCGR_PEP_ID=MMETSP0945-20130129/6983_1 /TAXON_ID=109269 /ORGANISM="Vaucheria litorea, Strain CCMP2940" /LENGTH=175 /DNA_ID=CAMNT_0011989979 /DNA_START=82 /DNA_END=609 /DNA_ORIENTATION=-